MKDIKKIQVSKSISLKEAITTLNANFYKILLVVDSDGKFIGTISDGDIRRSLILGKELSSNIEDLFCKNSFTSQAKSSINTLEEICRKNSIRYVPILDENNRVIDLFSIDDYFFKNHDNRAVIMAGGLGLRLRPLTEETPKPMLKVGKKPILETIVLNFVKKGFRKITICTGYKAQIIKDYFGDGNKFGAQIDYVTEDKRMGTAGALTLLKKDFKEPFFVMNGDLLVDVNFEELMNCHISSSSKATMCLREYEFEVPYGVVKLKDKKVVSIDEKPKHSFYVNAGIYVLEPDCLKEIPVGKFFDMTNLFEILISKSDPVNSFNINGFWFDIGKFKDYEKANEQFR